MDTEIQCLVVYAIIDANLTSGLGNSRGVPHEVTKEFLSELLSWVELIFMRY